MLCAFIVWLNTFVCDMGARPGYEPGTSLTLQLQTVVLRLQKLKQRLRQPPAERDAKSSPRKSKRAVIALKRLTVFSHSQRGLTFTMTN